jgi:hypothetical protein
MSDRKEFIQMTVKQLYEILGRYIEVGAGEWIVKSCKRDQFKTQKEYRNWLNLPPQSAAVFDIGEVLYFAVIEDDVDYGESWAVLLPPLFFKDENRAFYSLPPEDFVKGNRDAPSAKKLELAAKASKGSKKGFKTSAKTTKGSKKK